MIVVRFDIGAGRPAEIVLEGRRWLPGKGWSRDTLGTALDEAQGITDDYEYHPADGVPGRRLATIVATALGGEAILPSVPPGEPGTVY